MMQTFKRKKKIIISMPLVDALKGVSMSVYIYATKQQTKKKSLSNGNMLT